MERGESTATTRILRVAFMRVFSREVQLIVTQPVFFAVTRPASDTLAVRVLEDFQVKYWLASDG